MADGQKPQRLTRIRKDGPGVLMSARAGSSATSRTRGQLQIDVRDAIHAFMHAGSTP